jgi:flagellar operon protein
MNKINPALIPNVTRLPGSEPGNVTARDKAGAGNVEGPDFDSILRGLDKPGELPGAAGIRTTGDLGAIDRPIKFSAHALQRFQDRKIPFDAETLLKLRTAIDQAEKKGVQEALVITKESALIVSVDNRTVITAMDKNKLSGNIFTNIDGAVILD